MRFFPLLLTALLWIALSSPAAAAIYKWVDDNGTVTYTDTPPPAGKKSTVVEPIHTGIEVHKPTTLTGSLEMLRDKVVDAAGFVEGQLKGGEGTAPAPGSSGATGKRSFPPVELYVTSWCGYCKQARAFLQQRGVAFQEYDIERDPAAASRAAALNSRGGVPVAVIGGKTLIGFHQPSYERALGL